MPSFLISLLITKWSKAFNGQGLNSLIKNMRTASFFRLFLIFFRLMNILNLPQSEEAAIRI